MHSTAQPKPNSLIHESSPYLLQHAYNPVNWLSFSQQAFDLARQQNKPILISIGYSACHWCHVMEHESFENNEVAALMNAHFINIKVDREERSDVDMLYMQAVQLMTGRGGWPLNCFVLPDGRPFYGGTYFKKEQWLNVLQNLHQLYETDVEKVMEYATALTKGIVESELISTKNSSMVSFNKEYLKPLIQNWSTHWDTEMGGTDRAPKFPLPNNYRFLLQYAILEKDQSTLNYVNRTLTKMAFGGIYDQLHGGFARYSTDTLWKVPHFEKMLYDNAQLVSLYCEAFVHTKNELYKEIAIETLDFIKNEWYQAEGYFYSAFDADSDGEEGKYYVWQKPDLQEVLGHDFELFADCYHINDTGYWEQGNYILMRQNDLRPVLVKYNLTSLELNIKLKSCKQKLKQEVKSRIKPALDDKTISSWNALMCSACAQAYLSFGDNSYREMALQSIQFMSRHLISEEGQVYRTYKNGVSRIDGFLEDYAFMIEAFINCYLISQNETYLNKAKHLCELSLDLFKNPQSPLLFYTNRLSQPLAARTTEISDNVMPSSNSQMAINLYQLGTYFGIAEWLTISENMLKTIAPAMADYGSGYSNWARLALYKTHPLKEIAIVGKDVDEMLRKLYQTGLTNTILAVQNGPSELAVLKNRFVHDQTLIYVCENNSCKGPVNSINDALEQLE